MPKKLLRKIEEEDVIKRGIFKLKSGKTSNLYFDIKKLYGTPLILKEVSKIIGQRINDEVTVIAASGVGGIPIATLVSSITNKNLTIIRDVKKGHGKRKSIEGYIPQNTDRVAIVDDVFSSGTSIQNTEKEVQQVGAEVIQKIVILNRSGTSNVESLLTLEDLRTETK